MAPSGAMEEFQLQNEGYLSRNELIYACRYVEFMLKRWARDKAIAMGIAVTLICILSWNGHSTLSIRSISLLSFDPKPRRSLKGYGVLPDSRQKAANAKMRPSRSPTQMNAPKPIISDNMIKNQIFIPGLNHEIADSLSDGNHGNHHYYLTILIINVLFPIHHEFLTILFYFYPFLGYFDNNIIMYYYYFFFCFLTVGPFPFLHNTPNAERDAAIPGIGPPSPHDRLRVSHFLVRLMSCNFLSL